MRPFLIVLTLLLGVAAPAPAAESLPRLILASGCPERCDESDDPDRDSELVLMTLDGTRFRFLTDNTSNDGDGRYSPDEERIVFMCRGVKGRERANEICVMDSDGSDRRRLTQNTENEEDPSWAPSGRWIVFAGGPYPDQNLFKMRPDGSDVTQLTDMPGGEVDPSWSPDGSKIIFTHWGAVGPEIPETTWVVDADGSNAKQLAEGDSTQHDPEWSPDGQTIAVSQYYDTSDRSQGWQITLMSADGEHLRRLTTGAHGLNFGPHWAPTGRWIAFKRGRDFDIFKVRSDGTDLSTIYAQRRKYSASDWRSR